MGNPGRSCTAWRLCCNFDPNGSRDIVFVPVGMPLHEPNGDKWPV
jgi:hypothetical protein